MLKATSWHGYFSTIVKSFVHMNPLLFQTGQSGQANAFVSGHSSESSHPGFFNALHDSKRLQYLWVPASWEAHSSHLKKKKTDPYNLLSVEPLLVPQCVSVRVPWRNRSDGMSMYLSVLQPAVQIV